MVHFKALLGAFRISVCPDPELSCLRFIGWRKLGLNILLPLLHPGHLKEILPGNTKTDTGPP